MKLPARLTTAIAVALLLVPGAVHAQPGGQGSNLTEPVELQTRGVSYRVVPIADGTILRIEPVE